MDILTKQVPVENLFLIHEVPFSQAVRRTFEIGIEQNKKWTIAVDADILLNDNSVQRMVEKAESRVRAR